MQSGQYELHEIIGTGGFGTVYRATDRVLERQVAVKVLHSQLTTGPNFVERFHNEANTLARLKHPHIAPIYDLAEIDGRFLIVMKLLEGGSLQTRLQQGPLAYPQAVSILGEVCSGLQAAHSQGHVHRDLKPANILFDEAGQAVLPDFGLARLFKASAATASSQGADATPSYRAPELWKGEPPASPATDVYALGCIFYEMLSGRVLIAGTSREAIITRHLVDGPTFGPDWPPPGAPAWVAEVVSRATQRASEVRYLDAAMFYAALQAFERAERKVSEKAQQRAGLQRAEREARAGLDAEEKAQREAEEEAQRGAAVYKEEAAQQRAEAEARARNEAEAKAQREDQEKARRAAVLQAEAEAKTQHEVEEKARRIEAEKLLQLALQEAEEKTRREAEGKALQAAQAAQETQARLEADERAQQRAEAARLKTEAEELAWREAEERAHQAVKERAGGREEPRPAKSFMLELGPGVVMEFVRVPAGEFRMGSDPIKDPLAARDEQPQHTVLLSEYWIGKFPVTNRQYLAYVQARGAKMPEHWQKNRIPLGLEFHPVVNVGWQDAVEFCAWLSGLTQKGNPAWKVHLPTEAEWEKAARGMDGKIYPWGDSAPGINLAHLANWLKGTTEVGRFPECASPYGVLDLSGNVWQWVMDWYDASYYSSRPDGELDPVGPVKGRSRVLRGGAWHRFRQSVRAACRASRNPKLTSHNTGFRCAAALPERD